MSFHGGFASDRIPRNLHPSLQDRRQGQVRRSRHWSGLREDGVQSRTLAGEESSLDVWTVDSWQHCVQRARSKILCVDVTVSFCPAILPWCSHVNYVKEDAVGIREFF